MGGDPQRTPLGPGVKVRGQSRDLVFWVPALDSHSSQTSGLRGLKLGTFRVLQRVCASTKLQGSNSFGFGVKIMIF